MQVWNALFGQGASLSWGQECARSVVIFAYGLALVRLAGRRTFGKWSALDIIVSVMVGSNLSRALTGSAQLGGTLLATTLLMSLHWILAKAAAHSPRLSELLEGASVVLGRDGRTEPVRFSSAAVSQADLSEALRSQGVESVDATRLITLEPSGKINVLKKS